MMTGCMFMQVLLLSTCLLHVGSQSSYITLKNLGCWRDNYSRIIPSLEGTSSLLDGYYKARTDATQKCARVALQRGYRIFGIQDGGRCVSSARAPEIYNRLGRSTLCAANGKGGFHSNAVYDIVGTVRETPGRVSSRPRTVLPDRIFTRSRQETVPNRRTTIYTRPAVRRIPPISNSKINLENNIFQDDKDLTLHAFILSDLGCWALPSSGLQSLEGLSPDLDGHYSYRTKAVQKCARAVGELGYELFAMQSGGKCLTASNIESIYNENGRRYSCSYNGKGGASAVQVYNIRYSKTRNPPPPIDESPTHSSSRTREPASNPNIYIPFPRPTQTTTTTATSASIRRVTYSKNKNQEYFHLTDLGCWKYAWNDSIPSLERTSSHLDRHYSQREDAIMKCARVTLRFGFDLFAIQDGGRCVSSKDARDRFTNLGMSQYCRGDGRGGSWVNQVYEINLIWDVKLSGIGCYATGESGPIASLENTAIQLDGDYYRRKDPIRKCARLAATRGFSVFGIQDGGKCVADAQARENFANYGDSTLCSANGRGGMGAIQVYEITSAKKIKLRNLGCWKDEDINAVPGLEQTDGDLMDNYKTREDAIGKCARAAVRNEIKVFVIKDGGWCGGSTSAPSSYSLYGKSTQCNSNGEGGTDAIQVYEIQEE